MIIFILIIVFLELYVNNLCKANKVHFLVTLLSFPDGVYLVHDPSTTTVSDRRLFPMAAREAAFPQLNESSSPSHS
jgi:hypothetical protein